MSEEPDYSLEIDGHRYEVRDALLVAERYENFLGANRPVELVDRTGLQGRREGAVEGVVRRRRATRRHLAGGDPRA